MDFVQRHKDKVVIGFIFGVAAIVVYNYKQQLFEREQKIEGLQKELDKKKQEIIILEKKCNIFDQKRQSLTNSIIGNVNKMMGHLEGLKQVVEDLESHVIQLDNQNI